MSSVVQIPVSARPRTPRGPASCWIDGVPGLVGSSPAIAALRTSIKTVAPADSPVLVLGETGSGKELVARAIHALSLRSDGGLITVNCGALSRDLMEAELFGHEKGAFTGAVARRTGRIASADRATLFLDEIGELPLAAQAKLLRVIEEGEVSRLGSDEVQHVDVRLIAATNRDLKADVARQRFRADLYYRLNVFPLAAPPLRTRIDDLTPLVMHFLQHLQARMAKPLRDLTPASWRRLRSHHWPGNVRELRNVIERAALLATTPVLDVALGAAAPGTPTGARSERLDDVVREHIEGVLRSTNWVIEGPAGAATRLALSPSTLRFKMKKLGIVRPH